jgi:CBS domain-containing protein
MLVKDYMTKRVVTLLPEMELLRAAHILIRNDISGAPVLNEQGQLVGILTERDCMRVAMQADYYGVPGGLVKDHMSENPQSVDPGESILKLAGLFLNGRFHRYPVLNNSKLVGVISRRDVMRAMGEFYPL